MKEVMAILGATLVTLAAITGCVYLVMHGHPWFGFFVLMAGGSKVQWDDDKKALTAKLSNG